jgi:hypothetical protein
MIGAADADVDDVADTLAGVLFPGAVAHSIGEIDYAIQHGMDLRHHVLAVHHDRVPFWRTQRHMQYGAVLSQVDLSAAEHGLDALAQAARLG